MPVVMRALNQRTNSRTGYSPYHLIFGTAMTQRLDALASESVHLGNVTSTPIPQYVRQLDNSLRLLVDAGLQSTEDTILKNYLKCPEEPQQYKVGDLVYHTNVRPITRKLGKWAPNYAGPAKVITAYGNNVFQLQDLVQDTTNFYVHACDLVRSNITSEEAAREIAKRDYKEEFVTEVISHECNPENPDLLGQLFFNVKFADNPDLILTVPYSAVQYVDVVKAYLQQHQRELPAAYKKSCKTEEITGLRVRKPSQFLEGYETAFSGR